MTEHRGEIVPYFDAILKTMESESGLAESFGHHTHFGYWDDPSTFDLKAKDYHEAYADAAEALTIRHTAAMNIDHGLKILDVGCGFGGTVATMNALFDDLDLVGLNIDPQQIARAKETVKARSKNKVDFLVGDACKLPFEDGTFDRVLAAECIFHFPSRPEFFQHLRRVLKTGGRAVISDFVTASPAYPMVKMLNWIESKTTKTAFGHGDVTWTVNMYRKLGAEHGLELTHVEDVTRNIMPSFDFYVTLAREHLAKHVDGGERMGDSLAMLGFGCRTRMIRYLIMTFDLKG